MKHKVMKIVFTLTLALMATACGKIPSAYVGTFVDQTTGSTLILESSAGTFTTADGHSFQTPAQSADVKLLAAGKAGIYVRAAEDSKNDLEIFWINPDLSTRREEYGFVFMSSEVLYTRMNAAQKGKVDSITLRHCRDGQVSVDVPTQTFNGGCPADSQLLKLVRTK